MPDFTGSQIDHVDVPVSDLDRSVAFYAAALEPLGIATVMAVPATPAANQKAMHAFGRQYKPFLWLVEVGRGGYDADTHLALTAPDRATVRAFYEAALAAGGTTLREPGVWSEYHADYYGAFVADPDGLNLEAVCHQPED